MKDYELKEQMFGYLNHTFGDGFTDLIELPKGLKIGERVLYRLKDDQIVERKEFDKVANDEFRKVLEGIAEKSGGFLAPPEIPVESGLPNPRMVDIAGWEDVSTEIAAKKYALSDDLLPSEDFAIEWLCGLMFGYSNKQFVYIDFTHPKVKMVFSSDFDSEYDIGLGRDMQSRFAQFIQTRKEVITALEEDQSMQWTKLLQLNNSTFVQSKTK